ncbi:hypothetical protein V5735_19035 [Haladaptatus sp. SPP-AMP-3]|uniref:hypothetical protein n=1 Tax=Haladaptatus sp. SPP-AMP-3 TaxID=3121295 RepID=UPI003C2CFB30
MVSDILITAAIGGTVGAVVTAAASLFQTHLQQQSENIRWHAEFYLERKVESLMDLHAALEHAKLIYIEKGLKIGYGTVTKEDVDEVISVWQRFEQKLNQASVFLTNDQQQILSETLDKFHEANPIFNQAYEERNMAPSDFARREILDKYREGSEVLKEEINGPIKEFSN